MVFFNSSVKRSTVNSRQSLIHYFDKHPDQNVHARAEEQEHKIADVALSGNLRAYFESYNGEKTIPPNLRQLVESVYDKDQFVLFTEEDGEIPFDRFYKTIEVLHQAGTVIEVMTIAKHEKGIEYQIKVNIPGEFDGQIRAICLVANSKIVGIESQFFTNNVDKQEQQQSWRVRELD